MTSNPLKSILFMLLLAGAGAAARAADEDLVRFDFDQVVTVSFWERLYPAGGYTLMCGQHFDLTRRIADGRNVTVDFLFPLGQMLKQLGCRDRAECRARHGARFARMEADLHNMYPEAQELVTMRIGRRFGLVEGEEWRFDDCDVEWRNGVLEPRELARGNIARAVLYMRATHGLDLDDAQLEAMKAWHVADPPSKQEHERNDAIEVLQGRRNAFVDRPEIVENLRNLKQ